MIIKECTNHDFYPLRILRIEDELFEFEDGLQWIGVTFSGDIGTAEKRLIDYRDKIIKRNIKYIPWHSQS